MKNNPPLEKFPLSFIKMHMIFDLSPRTLLPQMLFLSKNAVLNANELCIKSIPRPRLL